MNVDSNSLRLDLKIASRIEDGDLEVNISPILKNNLRFEPRQYQKEAFTALNYYINHPRLRARPSHILFHMATGSGKTLIMAGAILDLYKMGYRNFIFFVHTDTIIRKTKENFLNVDSHKYLFNKQINIEGENVKISEVDNFDSSNSKDINILFSTIQGLHSKLNTPRENSITIEDFASKDVVIISDEAHHLNSLTKKRLNKTEDNELKTWEYTAERILESNTNNIMMDFTATLELSHPNIASKYSNKLIYDYSLAKYREDGYSKEVQTNQVDYEPLQRAIVAVFISQFKKKIFSSNGLIVKPVIMFKSKTTAESAEIEKAFINEIKQLNGEKLNDLINLKNSILQKAIAYFKELDISFQGLIDEIKDDFSEDKIISINSKNDNIEKQLLINSLEKQTNEIRAVFSVDKLNEGWDVLNLYDIVRLYDTRDSKGSTPGPTTIREAQLIGRGARYFPFRLNESQELYKRKFDDDIDNIMRYCETLHYHCSHNPRYINELNNALRQIGMVPEERNEVNLILKDDFKQSSLYKNGFIFLNKKVKNTPEKLLLEYQEPEIQKRHKYSLKTNRSDSTLILDDTSLAGLRSQGNFNKEHSFSVWDKTIILKGLNKIPFYQFRNISRYFPKVKSMRDFVSDSKYFGGISVIVSGLENDVKNLSPSQKLNIVLKVALDISNQITTEFGDYRGTKSFYRHPIKKYFRDKRLTFSSNKNQGGETGKPTMRYDIPEKFIVNLNNADWYVYNENYGSSEEKFLVRYINDSIDDLKENFKDIYLIRNERFFKLFRFSDGKATEPDFVMFMTDINSNKELIYQLFIEPKGDMLLLQDEWKEQFLLEIENESLIELYQNQEYRLIGMPFYNKSQREAIFSNKLSDLVKNK